MPIIRCPKHHVREEFTPPIPQPLDSSRVRYPCGYIDGEPEPPQSLDQLAASLNRLASVLGEQEPTPRPKASPLLRTAPIQSPPAFYKGKANDAQHFS